MTAIENKINALFEELVPASGKADTVDQVKRNGYITLNDCACGAGATLIAGIHQARI